jgi:RNA polymerase sigma-70 factor (ECF subfamily)
MSDDRHLIEQFVQGDEAAFAQIIQNYQESALMYAQALLDNRDQARDVAQEAFIAAHAHRTELRDLASFSAWFKSIVRTIAARARRIKQGTELHEDFESLQPNPEVSLELQQQRQLVAVAVAGLPEHERIVVQLFYLAGSTQDDIATSLGIPVGTVKTRLHSARARLGEQLLALLSEGTPLTMPRQSLEFIQRVRLFSAFDRRDIPTLRLLLAAAPSLVHELRRREDERVAGVRWGLTPLHLAARAGDTELVELFLEFGADIEGENTGPDAPHGATPLYVAAAWGRGDVVRLLLRHRAQVVGKPGANPLRAAIVHSDHPDIAQELIAAGAIPTIFEATALGDEHLVRQLLDADSTLANARLEEEAQGDNPTTHTPLHIAARKNLLAIAELLVAAGAPAGVPCHIWGHHGTRLQVTTSATP